MTQHTQAAKSIEISSFPKEVLIVVPLIGSALAITFDVGYFYGIDINLFTLFSVSEHIVFALEALPFAFAAAAVLVINYHMSPFSKSGRAMERGIRKVSESSPTKGKLLLGLSSAMFLAGGFVIYFRMGVLALALCLVAMAVIVAIRVFEPSRFTLLILVSASLVFLSFIIGRAVAIQYLEHAPYSHSILGADGQISEAKLIRSGEKGVLYLDRKTLRLVFAKWDRIAVINSQVDRMLHVAD